MKPHDPIIPPIGLDGAGDRWRSMSAASATGEVGARRRGRQPLHRAKPRPGDQASTHRHHAQQAGRI